MVSFTNQKVDKEWVELIQEALEIGLTIEEVREFIDEASNEWGQSNEISS